MRIKLLTEPNLEYLSLKGGCTGSSESTLVKMPHCWKSHVTAQILSFYEMVFSDVAEKHTSFVTVSGKAPIEPPQEISNNLTF